MSIFSKIFTAIENAVQRWRTGAMVSEPMTSEEVEHVLKAQAELHPEKLDWQASIVDLLKLLDLDSSLKARRDLATELGFIGTYEGTTEQNLTLHKMVMDDVAKRYISIPHKTTGL